MMIDVIIPAYNAHDYIRDALNSLDKQTIKERLVITIVDDGSEKKYDEIISSFPNLKVNIIRLKRNRGVAVAKQIGINRTHNQYVTFLDSDDILVGNKAIEKLVKVISEDANYKVARGREYKEGVVNYSDGHMYAKIFKREVIDKYNIRIPKLKLEEDTAFTLSYYMMLNGGEVTEIKDVVYRYRKVNDNSLTNSCVHYYDFKYFFRAIDYVYKYVKKYKRYENFKNKLFRIFLSLADTYFYRVKNEFGVREDYLRNCCKFIKKYKEFIGKIPVSGLTKYSDLEYDLACRFWKVLEF